MIQVIQHRTDRNWVYTFYIGSRVYRIVGDLYEPATMYNSERRIDAGEQANYTDHWLRFPELYRCDG